jgi:hypothetical protein
MPSLTICPANFDIFVHHGDELPWSFTILGSNGQPVDITSYVFDLAVDEVEEPEDPETEVFNLDGTIVDAVNGVVEFVMDSLQAETPVGRYYYQLYATNALGQTYVASSGRFIFVDSCDTNTVSDVDICNMALGFIGDTATITNIKPPDQSAQAQLCSKFYPMALRSTLEMHNWAFATRRSECTPVGVEPGHDDDHDHDHDHDASVCDCAEWEYFYQLPRHFLKAIAVLPNEATNDYEHSQDFTVQLDSTGVPRLYTDTEDAVMLYTEYVAETHLFPPMFQMAVAWHLASMLAGPILKGEVGSAESKRCLQMMMMYVGKAAKTDSEIRRVHPEHTASWIKNR